MISAIIIKGPSLLQNARILSPEIHQTTSLFLSWAKGDSSWTGHWSSFPEGVVDMADMNLSDVAMQITIWSKEGEIDGTIATKEICKNIPLVDYVLLRGKVSGNTATVAAWDIIQGQKTDFALLKIVREGEAITVTPTEGFKEWFPATARLGRHPLKSGKAPEPNQTFCAEERKSFFEKIRPSGKG